MVDARETLSVGRGPFDAAACATSRGTTGARSAAFATGSEGFATSSEGFATSSEAFATGSEGFATSSEAFTT
ncbi:MAG: hypothetical protein ACK5U8_20215, partial [Deltaproteobacteria bacterium]